jgi:hypothetical protein
MEELQRERYRELLNQQENSIKNNKNILDYVFKQNITRGGLREYSYEKNDKNYAIRIIYRYDGTFVYSIKSLTASTTIIDMVSSQQLIDNPKTVNIVKILTVLKEINDEIIVQKRELKEEHRKLVELRRELKEKLDKLDKLDNVKTSKSISHTKGTHGGSKAPIVKKEINGILRCIYKIPSSRKEYIKYKGRLIAVADYKKLTKKA